MSATAVEQLPLADLHCHAETAAGIDRLLASRGERAGHDWAESATKLRDLSPGIPRLEGMNGDLDAEPLRILDADHALFLARVEAVLEQGAEVGAVLLELRFGAATVLRRDFMQFFRQAEERVRTRHPTFYAEPLISGIWPSRPNIEQVVEACIAARSEGLAGVDILMDPYEAVHPDEWSGAYRLAERLAASGLGITAHGGEFSSMGLRALLDLPGLSRLGHGVQLSDDPAALELVRERDIAIECCLTSNVVLGAVPSLDAHPLMEFVRTGLPVMLNTDNPIRLNTSIRREYELAAELGLSPVELGTVTRTAIERSFTTSERKKWLLEKANEATRV